MAAHSVFGGSSAYRYLNCHGSVAFLADIAEPPSTSYADEGTCAHGLAEWCLTNGERDVTSMIGADFPYELRSDGFVDGSKMYAGTISRDMAVAVQVYLDAVYAELDAAKDAELYVEQRFELDVAEPGEVFGANDAMVYTPSRKRLVVFDYKHGVGSVDVEDNDQLKFYGAGALLVNGWPIADLELVVVQARDRDLDDEDDGVKRWPMDPVEVIEFIGELKVAIAAAKAAQKGEALVAGPWCKKTFCKGQATCPAKQADILAVTGLDFKDIVMIEPANLPDPSKMNGEQIAKIIRAASIVRAWVTQVEEFAFNQAHAGVAIPGKKLVEKIGRAKWIADETAVAQHLELQYGVDPEELRPRQIVTITEAERLVKAAVGTKAFKDAKEDMRLRFTLKESSGLTLVDDSDKRDSVDPAAAFAAVNIPDVN